VSTKQRRANAFPGDDIPDRSREPNAVQRLPVPVVRKQPSTWSPRARRLCDMCSYGRLESIAVQ